MGVETLAASLSEQRDAIEEIIEPYMIQQGLLQRTPRGRVLTPRGFSHLGLKMPKEIERQLDMLTAESGEDVD